MAEIPPNTNDSDAGAPADRLGQVARDLTAASTLFTPSSFVSSLTSNSPSSLTSNLPTTSSSPPTPTLLLDCAASVRQAYTEGPLQRLGGKRLTTPDGTDAEFAAPLNLALELDRYVQSCTLEAFGQASPGRSPRREGVSADAFETIWESTTRDLSGVVATATGCTDREASEVIRQCGGDCSIAVLSLLHNKGDPFQKQCAHASAVELKRHRRERSLEIIVEDVARRGVLPRNMSSKRMLRTLQEHLPLSEIMGHRYRTPNKDVSVLSARRPSSTRKPPRVSFEETKEDDSDEKELEDEDESDSGISTTSKGSCYGASDASSFEGDGYSDDSDGGSDTDDGSTGSDSESDKGPRNKRSRRGRSNLMAAPPPNWTDGDPPNGGFYLDTFTKIYQGYKSFTSLHGKSLSFKSLIQHDIEPTVMMELGIRKVKTYNKLPDEQLLKRIKKRLGFQEGDYYARKLELLRMPPCNQSRASELYRSFRKLTTPFLRILREAQDSGVRLRSSNVSRIFKNHIRGYPALERWFLSKRFKTFHDAVRHISQEIHNRIATEVESHHDEMISSGQVSGARSDVHGGKAEPGKARNSGSGGGHGQNRNSQSQRGHGQGHSNPKRSRANDRGTPSSASNTRGDRRYPARSEQEEEAFQRALAKEKELPLGMFHHPRGPFCKENPCRSKICQGCNYHASPDGLGHIRPNCRCKDNPEFVAEGYFHDKHPGRTGALSSTRSANRNSGGAAKFGPPPSTAKIRQVTDRHGRPSNQ
jgi:hypothetical protein